MNNEGILGRHETESRSAVMSYAFKSFSPVASDEGAQGKKSLQFCAANFFKRFEALQQLTLYPSDYRKKEKQEESEAEVNDSQPLLGIVSDGGIKNWVGEDAYRQGLQYFMEGRLTDRKVSQSVLSSCVHEKAGSLDSYVARIEFKKARSNDSDSDERKKGETSYHHVSAWCECLERETAIKKRRRSVCPHIAALLISWARKPNTFERSSSENKEKLVTKGDERRQRLSDIAMATDRVFASLETMISLILEEGRCTDPEVLDMVQLMYSSMRLSTTQIGERWEEEKLSQDISKVEDFENILGFSFIANVINSRIFAALDMKYRSGMMQIKNNADVDALRKLVENFVELPQSSKTAKEEKEKGTVSSRVPVLRNQVHRKSSHSHAKEKMVKADREVNHSDISRSWDKIMEEFVSG